MYKVEVDVEDAADGYLLKITPDYGNQNAIEIPFADKTQIERLLELTHAKGFIRPSPATAAQEVAARSATFATFRFEGGEIERRRKEFGVKVDRSVGSAQRVAPKTFHKAIFGTKFHILVFTSYKQYICSCCCVFIVDALHCNYWNKASFQASSHAQPENNCI